MTESLLNLNEFNLIGQEDLEVRVSLCTPTFNRRPFLPYLINCVRRQTYPKHLMEWIIVDDGTDPVEDVFEPVKEELNVKYFYYPQKMPLGQKRNVMHEHCSGEIIVYIDDDDYYPPERVSHAVEMLCANPDKLIAGSSEMHIYFPKLQTLLQFGPYNIHHATAATFVFWKKFLDVTHYENENQIAEEKSFLKNYTIPLLQLDTRKSILVIAHDHNSFDKHSLLPPSFIQCCQQNGGVPPVDKQKYFDKVPCVQVSSLSFEDFHLTPQTLSSDAFAFYTTLKMNEILQEYPEGSIGLKPDVVAALEKLKMSRMAKSIELLQQSNANLSLSLEHSQQELKQLQDTNTHLLSTLKKFIQETADLRKEKEILMQQIQQIQQQQQTQQKPKHKK